LPGNVALAVGADIAYVEAKVRDEIWVLAKDRLSLLGEAYEIIAEHTGSEMVGMEYEPLYPYLGELIKGHHQEKNMEHAYKVYAADFVTTTDGTGIVHTAVMYGADDFELGTKVGLPKFHTLNEEGKFIPGTDFLEGRFVKDEAVAVDIIKDLAHRGLLFKKEKYEHSYPHCWRCKTPLIYYARDSWYIRMSDPKIKQQMIEENKHINWEPSHIRDGRFGEWLDGIKDWAISRERYWGTPLPVWQSEDGERIVVDSVETLKRYSKEGKIPTNEKGELDLHRPYIDDIVLEKDGKEFHRVKEVMDVWFDSGSMPFAQDHYPFEHKDDLQYPADFISEAIDQTRGWFYTLHAVGVLMGKGRAYNNVICLGHLLDKD
jgi:isoleucyl-tRNA synthetase